MSIPDGVKVPLCPECGAMLELWANGDSGPADDRWACESCDIEYPHSEFPLPPNYVRDARKAEKEERQRAAEKEARAALAAWNRWARRI